MIRRTTEADHDRLIELATVSGLFEPEQTDLLNEMLRAPAGTDIWFTCEIDGLPVGVAYLAPERMTNGTWNLYWIAIHPNYQRQGHGKAILCHIEQWLAEQKQRVLIVETAGVDDFNYVRKFYAANGFEAEARIRDFYDAGVDKVVFRKSLDPEVN